MAGGLLALAALASLRQRVKSARATFLLLLEERWEALHDSRKRMTRTLRDIEKRVFNEHSELDDQHRIARLREECQIYIVKLERENEELFRSYIEYLNFYETIGRMVKKKYVLFDDILNLYKGPILDADNLFRLHIETWQDRANVTDGLFENLIYLVDRTKRSEVPFITRLFNRICFWRS